MKHALFLCIVCFAVVTFNSCKNEKKAEPAAQQAAPAESAPAIQTSPDLTPVAGPDQATPPPTSPPQNAKGVWHYTCPKGCPGGSGSAGNCAKCGTALVHNAAYHEQ